MTHNPSAKSSEPCEVTQRCIRELPGAVSENLNGQRANGTKIEDTTPAMEQYIQVARFRRNQWARRDGDADSAA
jgi:hypothetical protein